MADPLEATDARLTLGQEGASMRVSAEPAACKSLPQRRRTGVAPSMVKHAHFYTHGPMESLGHSVFESKRMDVLLPVVATPAKQAMIEPFDSTRSRAVTARLRNV